MSLNLLNSFAISISFSVLYLILNKTWFLKNFRNYQCYHKISMELDEEFPPIS